MARDENNLNTQRNESELKLDIIKKSMKLFERVPSCNDLSLNEIFNHKNFIEASEEERKIIMQKSAEFRYINELEIPFESYFGFNLISLLNGKVVLDLGCFTGGRAVAWYERYGLKKIYGIDTKDNFIEAASLFAKSKGVNAEFICAKGEDIPFEDNKFDAIITYDVFEHVQNLTKVMSECNRILKKNGKLFIVFPSYFGPTEHHLSMVTITPFIHYFLNGNDLVDSYNQIIDERGEEENYWYRRKNRDLETWERCNTINGTTKKSFRKLFENSNWRIYYEKNSPLFRGMSKKYPLLKIVYYLIYPLAQIPILEEVLCGRIIYILEKT